MTIDPHWTHEFDGIGEIEADTIRVIQDPNSEPSERWIAMRAYDLEGWFLMRCKNLTAEYDRTATTESGMLSAWFMKTPMIPDRNEDGITWNSPFAWNLPEETFHSFRQNPDDNQFRDNILPLEGTIRIRGDGDTVHLIKVDLKNEDAPLIRFKGSVTRRWRPFQVNFVLI